MNSSRGRDTSAGDYQQNRDSSHDVDVSVVIVSYNTRAMTLQCLHTLHDKAAEVNMDVWVVDNASHDDTIAAIREAYPHVHIIENQTNCGFGAANNQAMARARGKYFLLLNSDAFVQQGAIAALVNYLDAHPRVAVVGPRLLNADGTHQTSCFRFPTPLRAWLENLWISALFSHHPVMGDYRRWNHDSERLVDSLSGACLLVRRDVYDQVGGFDERFFMYAEETDWQRAMRDRGWQIAFTPQACVTHLGGASGINEKARINTYFFDSLDLYEWKHHGNLGLVSLRLAMIIGCSLRAGLWLLATLQSKRRRVAQSKLRLMLWLVWRQATRWRLPALASRSAKSAS